MAVLEKFVILGNFLDGMETLFCHSALHCHRYIIINEIVSKYTKDLFYAQLYS
jgi:hypothetical protein